jgi:hypothetical protein
MTVKRPDQPAAPGLPPRAYATHPETGATICILRGHRGYWTCTTPHKPTYLNTRLDPPVTPAQAEAMLVGSLFGWDVPGANPAAHAKKWGRT